jgi:transposase
MEVEHEEQEIIQRVAALDIGKAELLCCVRVPGPGRRRMQVRTFSTMTRSLLTLSDWLAGLGVTRVVMEVSFSGYADTAVFTCHHGSMSAS